MQDYITRFGLAKIQNLDLCLLESNLNGLIIVFFSKLFTYFLYKKYYYSNSGWSYLQAFRSITTSNGQYDEKSLRTQTR